MERRLHGASVEELARFSEENPNPVMRVGLDGKLLYANKAGKNLLAGWELVEVGSVPEAIRAPCLLAAKDRKRRAFDVDVDGRVYKASAIASEGRDYVNLYLVDVTAERKAGAALVESERRFRELIENSSDVVLVSGKDFMISYASPSFKSILGMPSDGLLGTPVAEFFSENVHEDDIAGLMAKYEGCVRGIGKECRAEFRFRHPDGTWRHLVAVGMNRLDTPSIQGLVVNLRDITEQKAATEALRKNEALLRYIVENVHDIIWQMDANAIFTYVSPAVETVLGYAPSEVVGTSVLKLFRAEDVPGVLQKIKSRVNKAALPAVAYEYDMRAKDGSYVPIEVSSSAIFSPEGNVIGFSGVTRDIRERKRTEAEVRDNQMKFSTIFRENPAAIGERGKARVEADIRRKTGEARTILLSAEVIDLTGKKLMVSMAQDITERKRAENQLILKNRMLANISEYTQAISYADSSDLFTTIAHRLKAVTGAEEVILNEYVVESSELVCRTSTLSDENSTWLRNVMGRKLVGYRTPVSHESLLEMTSKTVGRAASLHDVTFKAMPKPVAALIEKMFGFGWYVGLALMHENSLVGTIMIAGRNGSPAPADEELLAYASATANVLARRKAEFAIAESESKFRHLAENIDLVFWLTDWVEKKLLYVNSAYERVFGMTVESAYADRTGWKKVIHPDDLEWAERAFQESVAAGEAMALDYRIVVDGKVKWIHERAFPLKDESGEIARYINVAEDVTEHKQAEEEIRRMHRVLQLGQQASRSGVWTWEIETGKLDWSDEMFELFGLDRAADGASFESWRKAMHPDDRAGAEERVNAAIRSRVKLNNEYRIVLPSGGVIWINAIGDTEYDGEKAVRMSGICVDITERKRAEEALRESEARYRELTDGISDCVAVYHAIEDGEDFVFLDMNGAGLKLEKVSRTEIIGRRVTEVFPGVRDMGLLDVFKRVWRTGKPEQYPISQYKDKRIQGWRENYIYKLPSGEIVAIYEDITEKKIAAEVLRLSEKKYRELFDNAGDAILIVDAETAVILDANRAAEHLLGRTRDEIIGINRSQIHPSSKSNVFFDDFKSHIGTGHIIDEESHILRKDGTVVPVRLTAKVFELGGRTVMQGIFRDITERKKAEQTIAESEARYRLIAENMEDTVWLMDLDMKVTYISPSVIKTRGYTMDELNDLPLDKQMTPESFELAMSVLESEMTPERLSQKDLRISHTFELEFKKKDGSTFWVEVTMTLLRDADGNPTSILGVGRDISERKAARDAMLKQRTLEARYTLTKIMTDVVPALLTMGRGEKSKDEFIAEMMRRLDAAFYDKYFPTQGLGLEEFGTNICALMNDMGGDFECNVEAGKLHIRGAACPWKNEIARNPVLCMINRGLIERFAQKALGTVAMSQISSLARGEPSCEFVVSRSA